MDIDEETSTEYKKKEYGGRIITVTMSDGTNSYTQAFMEDFLKHGESWEILGKIEDMVSNLDD